LLLADLEKNGLSFSEPRSQDFDQASQTLDLIGLPPAPEEIEAFLADDRPKHFARVVDRLLASPRYGERWGGTGWTWSLRRRARLIQCQRRATSAKRGDIAIGS